MNAAVMRGFTLIELIITVAIVAILASGLFPLAQLSVTRAKEQELRQGLREIRGAIDAYKKAADEGRVRREATESGYPPSLDALVQGVTDMKTVNGSRMFFLRRLPRDPFHPEETAPAQDSWGLRSYDSAPDSPVAGRDVFDVYSTSDRLGLNGVPYREW